MFTLLHVTSNIVEWDELNVKVLESTRVCNRGRQHDVVLLEVVEAMVTYVCFEEPCTLALEEWLFGV